jgi:hypothetical protein
VDRTIGGMKRAFCVAAVVLLCGCGSSPTAVTTTGKYAAALAYSHCMRSHGIAGFADPKVVDGGIQISGSRSGLDPASPIFRAAEQACRPKLPGGRPTESGKQRGLARMLRISRCMRAHGISGFPDPTLTPPADRSKSSAITSNGVAWLAIPASIDVHSPVFRRAADACNLGLQ